MSGNRLRRLGHLDLRRPHDAAVQVVLVGVALCNFVQRTRSTTCFSIIIPIVKKLQFSRSLTNESRSEAPSSTALPIVTLTNDNAPQGPARPGGARSVAQQVLIR